MYLLHCLGVIMQLVQGFIHHHKSIYHYLVLNNDKIIPSKLQKPYQVSHYLKHNTCRCHSILCYLKCLQIAISCRLPFSKVNALHYGLILPLFVVHAFIHVILLNFLHPPTEAAE